MKRGKLFVGAACMALGVLLAGSLVQKAHAADVPSDFNLQVTPSPLVTTVKPGVKTQLELRIRNGGSGTEALKIEPRSFSYSNSSDQVSLDDTAPPAVASWISFSQARFTVQPGEWFSQQISLDIPKTAGFSYSFALVISRQSDPKPTGGGRLIKGSLAVFTLVNVDRPGAKSTLEVVQFTSAKHLYEYLPATLGVRFRNNGNTIVQPYGNIFVQRGTNAKKPLATLAVNETKGYILPGTERTITATWKDGFPAYQSVANPDGTTSQKLVWNWTLLSHLRIGRYTAHLVAVYNQAGHDVPIEGNVSFWVIPWKILLVLLVLVSLVLFALFMLVRISIRSLKRKRVKRAEKRAAKTAAAPDKDAS